jgi:hypothetical protein
MFVHQATWNGFKLLSVAFVSRLLLQPHAGQASRAAGGLRLAVAASGVAMAMRHKCHMPAVLLLLLLLLHSVVVCWQVLCAWQWQQQQLSSTGESKEVQVAVLSSAALSLGQCDAAV